MGPVEMTVPCRTSTGNQTLICGYFLAWCVFILQIADRCDKQVLRFAQDDNLGERCASMGGLLAELEDVGEQQGYAAGEGDQKEAVAQGEAEEFGLISDGHASGGCGYSNGLQADHFAHNAAN